MWWLWFQCSYEVKKNCELSDEDINDEKKCDGGGFDVIVDDGKKNCI